MPNDSIPLFLPTESCSELPPVDNSVFVAKEVEGQILGDYLCIKGYHLVGKQSLVLNISEELDVSPPECRCEFGFSVHITIFLSFNILLPVGHAKIAQKNQTNKQNPLNF